jgi:hydrogenase maturation protein HypF
MKPTPVMQSAKPVRLKLALRGAVQGVGFRPFVYRLATELGLHGWVNNSPAGVFVEAEGPQAKLAQFLERIESGRPPNSFVQSLESSWLDPVGYQEFLIRPSETGGAKTALVLPDIATCPSCVREILDPANRRYGYPFTNCTNCGPRFSIIESLPYDRQNTSMKQFPMCPECQAEYDAPANRRFHAQPNACPKCGPQLELWNSSGESMFGGHEALLAARSALRAGKIVAVKGIGGFHLFVDARNESAVRVLRERKHREAKPFALIFPTLAGVKALCEVSPLEERLLRSPEAPIVLLKRLARPHRILDFSPIAPSAAPNNPNLGVMLPSNPLHHLLLAGLGFAVVATSGNQKDEPLCTNESDALERLGDIADLFLVHNRPIVRHVDDSIARVMLGREMILRRARGYAPLPIQLPSVECEGLSILAVGAHLKNSVALSVGNQVFLSQHIGDLETEPAHNAFHRVIADFQKLYDAIPEAVACDLHPDYLSTKTAREISRTESAGSDGKGKRSSPKLVGVQHHIAHVLSCMTENEIEAPALGVSWDGTGYGSDGTIWGGEFFHVTAKGVERVAHLRPFQLPGGDRAVKEPRRSALGLLYELFGESVFQDRQLGAVAAFTRIESTLFQTMLHRGLNSPLTSSMGRLFDGVASLANLRQETRFEGQAAMDLEFALEGIETEEHYDISLIAHPTSRLLDWVPMLRAILADVQRGERASVVSAKFHNALVEGIVAVARQIAEPRVALSGGCFQNRYLTERAVRRLREENFQPYWHQRVPPNDGGIALGQIMAARRGLESWSAAFTPLQLAHNERAPEPRAGSQINSKRTELRVPIQTITHHASR